MKDSAAEVEVKVDQTTNLDKLQVQYKAEVEAAGQALMAAVIAYAEAIKNDHGLAQWREGFNLGWKSSREHFRTELESTFKIEDAKAGIGGLVAFHAIPLPLRTATLSTSSPPTLTPTANDLVHQFIHENPGRRGIEIADNFSKTVWRLPERTVRTALHRLKKAKKIVVVEGRWYTVESAPEAKQPSLEMEAG